MVTKLHLARRVAVKIRTSTKLKRTFEIFTVLHSIALIHAIAISIIMTLVLYAWKEARNSPEMERYLRDLACTYEANFGDPMSFEPFEKECLSR